MIKSIQDQTNSLIEIEEDGTVCISCVGGEGISRREIIEAMTTPPQVGKIYKTAKVVSVKEFGVFVEISPGGGPVPHQRGCPGTSRTLRKCARWATSLR